MGMLSMMNNSNFSRHLADVSQGLAVPQSNPNPASQHYGKRRKKNILLVPGEAQLFLGITGLVMLGLQLEDFFVPITTATLWMIGSGLIALCSSCCTFSTFTIITNGFSNAQIIPCTYRRFSLKCFCAYEIIVLIGILLSFTAAAHSFYVMLTRSHEQITPGISHTVEMETSESILSSLLGLILCFVQSFVLYTIQKAVIQLNATQKFLERQTRTNVLDETVSHNRNHNPVININPVSMEISTENEHVDHSDLSDNLPCIVHSSPPPSYSSIAPLEANPSPNFSTEFSSTTASTDIVTVLDQERIGEPNGLPPRYVDIARPCERPPPPFSTSRETLHNIASLPPSYSEIIGFPIDYDSVQTQTQVS